MENKIAKISICLFKAIDHMSLVNDLSSAMARISNMFNYVAGLPDVWGQDIIDAIAEANKEYIGNINLY